MMYDRAVGMDGQGRTAIPLYLSDCRATAGTHALVCMAALRVYAGAIFCSITLTCRYFRYSELHGSPGCPIFTIHEVAARVAAGSVHYRPCCNRQGKWCSQYNVTSRSCAAADLRLLLVGSAKNRSWWSALVIHKIHKVVQLWLCVTQFHPSHNYSLPWDAVVMQAQRHVLLQLHHPAPFTWLVAVSPID